MANLSALLIVWSAVCGFVYGRTSISAERLLSNRDAVNSVSHLRRGLASTSTSGDVPTALGGSLYWFGNFSVGDSGYLRLLIDTGSTDCLLNYGVYKASKYELPYHGNQTFSITYEGVNRAGFGFETVNGTVQRDIITAGGLTVRDQPMGNTTSWKYIDVPQLPYANQGKGIIGFLGQGSSSFVPGASSWFNHLAHHGLIAEKRFGMAFGTSGKGEIIVGELDTSLIAGDLVTVHRSDAYEAFTIKGDFTIDGKIFEKDQVFIIDVGTDNLQSPIDVAQKTFAKLGYQTNLKTSPPSSFNPGVTSKTLLAYFDCDKPPTIGFSFPAQSELAPGQKATNFDVSTLVWDVYRHKHNSANCTSILGGTNALTNKTTGAAAWLIGQSFFAGHYVDFNIENSTLSWGNLKDPSGNSTA